VKIGTRQVRKGLLGGSTKVVSGKLSSRAGRCMVWPAMPAASGKTASWFPPDGQSLTTSARLKPDPVAQPATASVSIAAPGGRAATPIAVRAGQGAVKCLRYAAASGHRERQARWRQLVTGNGVTCHGR
jgi:hypothetical protein